MPVILATEDEAQWLDPATPQKRLYELLVGLAAADTAVRPVGLAVNDARYDGPECLAPATHRALAAQSAPSSQDASSPLRSGQPTLF
jgi:putative SOS response-associated peptidase YedK